MSGCVINLRKNVVIIFALLSNWSTRKRSTPKPAFTVGFSHSADPGEGGCYRLVENNPNPMFGKEHCACPVFLLLRRITDWRSDVV